MDDFPPQEIHHFPFFLKKIHLNSHHPGYGPLHLPLPGRPVGDDEAADVRGHLRPTHAVGVQVGAPFLKQKNEGKYRFANLQLETYLPSLASCSIFIAVVSKGLQVQQERSSDTSFKIRADSFLQTKIILKTLNFYNILY